jgi:hypothetical protein
LYVYLAFASGKRKAKGIECWGVYSQNCGGNYGDESAKGLEVFWAGVDRCSAKVFRSAEDAVKITAIVFL